jgi:TonB family protein
MDSGLRDHTGSRVAFKRSHEDGGIDLRGLKMFLRFTAVSLLLVAAAAAGCEGCQGEPPEEPPPAVEPDVGVEKEDEPVDPLAEEKKNAEELAVEVAVSRGDVARNVAAEMEALANAPKKPKVRKPRVAEPETGKLAASAIKRVFSMNDSAFRKCYERSLKGNPGLEGKVKMSIVIASDGTVSSASVKPVSLKDAKVNDCMERQARTMRFPEPEGGSVRVNKPFTFTPDF